MSGRGAPLPREGSPTGLCPLIGSCGDPRGTPEGPGEPAVRGWVPPRVPRLTLLLSSVAAGTLGRRGGRSVARLPRLKLVVCARRWINTGQNRSFNAL